MLAMNAATEKTMTPKPATPWTAGRKAVVTTSPKVRCEGGQCTWSGPRPSLPVSLSVRLRAASFRLKQK